MDQRPWHDRVEHRSAVHHLARQAQREGEQARQIVVALEWFFPGSEKWAELPVDAYDEGEDAAVWLELHNYSTSEISEPRLVE